MSESKVFGEITRVEEKKRKKVKRKNLDEPLENAWLNVYIEDKEVPLNLRVMSLYKYKTSHYNKIGNIIVDKMFTTIPRM